jgi:ADP-ribosyl-[dinitrogen reductase] hydrolase
MLVELAVGDSYGAGREYAPPADVAANNDGKTYVQHYKWKDLTPGRYTDDTQMSVGLAEHLLSGHAHTYVNLAGAFLRAFHRDQRAGYASGFYALLQEVKTPEALLRRLTPLSDKSGGAMRAAPCGMLPSLQEAIDLAFWQACLTHASRDGATAAGAVAALVWAARRGHPQEALPALLQSRLPGPLWLVPWTGKVGAPGLDSVRAALTAVKQHDNLNDILKTCIGYTGDVDTVAAIAMAIASVHPSITDNLDQGLYNKLEPTGNFGLPFLTALDKRLTDKYPLQPPKVPDAVPAGS